MQVVANEKPRPNFGRGFFRLTMCLRFRSALRGGCNVSFADVSVHKSESQWIEIRTSALGYFSSW
jgi:hypothetical protein